MPGVADQIDFDFGTDELNDPNYEANVDTNTGGDDNVTETQSDAGGSAQGVQDTQAGGQDGTQQAGARDGTGGNAQQDDETRRQLAGATRADKNGNLIDKDGNIVAAAGQQRRLYERNQQLMRHNQQLERQLADRTQISDRNNVLNGAPARMGLTPNETELGLQLVASFKKDPVATARWALQETMRMGYNLQQIIGADAQGNLQGGTLDLGAVKAMITEQLAPLIGDRQASQREQQAQAKAQRDYDAFVANHEHAELHGDIIAGMLRSNPKLTPEAAYWQLVAYAARNGLNMATPLRDQVQAQQRGEQPQQAPNGHARPNPAPNGQQFAPMPTGTQMGGNVQSNPDMASPNDSWDSIVQQSLRAAGYN